MLQRKQVPTPPMPLFARAAAAPATPVPCPSLGRPAPGRFATKSKPGNTAPARSGCVGSTPESTIAMTTSGEPVVMSHAAGRSSAA